MSPAVFVCSVCVFVVFFHSKEQDYGHLENGECIGHWVVVKSFHEPSQLFDHCVCNMDFCSNGLVKIGGRENINTAQKMKFFIKVFFGKYDQIRRKLRTWSHSLKKSLMENFMLCAV